MDNKASSNALYVTSCDRDIFRDTPIRYLGYANEVGEAFRALVHVNVVRLSYAIACSYVAADAASKGTKAAAESAAGNNRGNAIGWAVADTLIWQGLASVAIPGFTINRICWMTNSILRRTTTLPTNARKWTTMVIGLGAIPFIIKPIDHSVDWMLDNSLRKLRK